MGTVGFGFYILSEELCVEYYEIAFFTFSSGTVGLAMVLFYLFRAHWVWLLVAIAGGILVNSKVLLVLKDRTVPLDTFPLPVEVVNLLSRTKRSFQGPF
ncbi:hypothetical protein OB920_20670 [Halobacteria archaeon HArc-gm2]|nr:hypothetical protein [Halobacteria archaeon HArc-gm2]